MLLHNKDKQSHTVVNIKIRICFILLCAGLIILWMRAFFIQIIWRGDLIKKVKSQYWKKELVYGTRGDIYTKDNVLLANTVVLKSVFVLPKELDDPRRVSIKLSKILGIGRKKVLKAVSSKRSFVWIKRKISDKQAKMIEHARLSGVYLTDEMARVYPQQTMAGQLIGFVGIDNRGLEGLEKGLDEILSGAKQYHLVQRDGKGRIIYAPGELSKSVSGKDVFLTIDSRIQTIVEDALAKGVIKTKGNYGMAMVVYVPTGEILAWAQYPFFNPNRFRSYSPKIWRNRIALDMIEPGSTIKPLVVAAALANKTTSLDKIYYCENGRWRFKNVVIRDTHEYKWLSVPRIIRYSSNICTAKIGLELGGEKLLQFFEKIGFTKTTNLPLPGEAKGMVDRERFFNDVDLANISFGQGISITPLQLVRAYLCLGNYGQFKQLKLIDKGEDSISYSLQVIPRDVAKAMLKIMKDVVEKDGTGTLARIPGFSVGGKTGTAQKVEDGRYSKEKYQACFVGFIPAEEPKYLGFVLVDEPKTAIYGGVVSAPIVREIFKGIILFDEKITPNKLNTNPTQKSKKIVLKRDLNLYHLSQVPDFRGMCLREVLRVCAKKKDVPNIRGKGPIVVRQYPTPGTKWKGQITLWLGYQTYN